MKFIIAFITNLFLCVAAFACTPIPSDIRIGYVQAAVPGVYAYWFCTNATTKMTTIDWRAIPVASINVTQFANARSYIAGKNPTFIATPYLLNETDPKIAPLYAAAMKAARAELAAMPKP